MSEQERDYADEEVAKEIVDKFHGAGYTDEQRRVTIGNVGLMWQKMAAVPVNEMDEEAPLDAARMVFESGLSEDFNEAFNAVIDACGKVMNGASPAKVMGFIYGLHRAGEAALETFVFMTELSAALDAMAVGPDEEE